MSSGEEDQRISFLRGANVIVIWCELDVDRISVATESVLTTCLNKNSPLQSSTVDSIGS